MENGNFFQEFIAGNTGGLIGITVVYPLDTAKMRLQTYPHYKGAYDVISSMVKANGVTSLYRGLTSPALGFGLTFAVSFSAYGHGCRSICEWKNISRDKLSYLDLTMAGAYTGIVQTPVRQVVERIKGVMQVRERDGGKSPYKWSGACFVELIKKEGIRNGLFQGMSSVFLREVPQFAIYYPAYEYFRGLYSEVGVSLRLRRHLCLP
jgi:solute carrier family 25 carnitine/acylcarnitine transporter 20/29